MLQTLVAESSAHLQAARDLVSRRYAWRGYEVAASDDGQHQYPSSRRFYREITFLTAAGETPLGTLTLGLDGPQGLLAEHTHEDVIDQARAAGRKVCELTRFALEERVDSKLVLAHLFGFAHAVGRKIHHVTDVFIEVNPRHVGFYSRVLGFAIAAGEKLCERVQAPSVLLRLELEALDERLRTGQGGFAAALGR